MRLETRFKLHFGPYRAPRFKYGARVLDAIRGDARIVGLSDGRIPWPIGQKGRAKSFVFYGALVRAVRNESSLAVAHWWGVSVWMVNRWRRALGVPPNNDGTLRLRRGYGHEPFIKRALRMAVAKARDPERLAKIAAARRGKKRPRHVVEAVIAAHVGTNHSAETRRKMSLAHKRRGTRPPKAGRPWTSDEEAICRTLSIADVMLRTGRTENAVKARRRVLGMPDGRRRKSD